MPTRTTGDSADGTAPNLADIWHKYFAGASNDCGRHSYANSLLLFRVAIRRFRSYYRTNPTERMGSLIANMVWILLLGMPPACREVREQRLPVWLAVREKGMMESKECILRRGKAPTGLQKARVPKEC